MSGALCLHNVMDASLKAARTYSMSTLSVRSYEMDLFLCKRTMNEPPHSQHVFVRHKVVEEKENWCFCLLFNDSKGEFCDYKKAATLILEKFCNTSRITLAEPRISGSSQGLHKETCTPPHSWNHHQLTQPNSNMMTFACWQANPESFYSETVISMLPPTHQ